MKKIAERLSHCRACGSIALNQVLNLGTPALMGTFPAVTEEAERYPLSLCQCGGCKLLQLEHIYPKDVLFERDYGYRSGLNRSMVDHLGSLGQDLGERFKLKAGDTVVDIGSNDGTFLRSLPDNLRKIGVDPGMARYRDYYKGIEAKYLATVEGYFPDVEIPCGPGQAQLITTIAMFYGSDTPRVFMEEVRRLLARDGIWYCEMQYAAVMLDHRVYDGICHEHACYYNVRPLLKLAHVSGLKIADISFNSTNGGSIGLVLVREDSNLREDPALDFVLAREDAICSTKNVDAFGPAVLQHAKDLHHFLLDLVVNKKKRVYGMGASTKGNVVLQLAHLSSLVHAIGEVNENKFGRRTPGTHIPILPENGILAANPDYLLILPWHFRSSMLERYQDFTDGGGKLIFPLPEIEVYP